MFFASFDGRLTMLTDAVMPSASSVLSKTATTCAVAVAVYAIILGALLTPPLQRL